MKKKVLHLVTGLGVGGAEMMLLKTLPLLQEYFENEVCCVMGRGPVGERLREAGVPVHYLDLNGLNLLAVVWKFASLINKFKPDLLVTYLIHADLFGRIIGRLMGIRNIVSSQRGFYVNWKFLRVFDKWTSFLVKKYFVQTEFARMVLMNRMKLSEDKFSVIPNAINIDEYGFELDKYKKKEELGLPCDNLNVVCVSSLKPEKGYEELLEAFENVFNENRKINLLLVGAGTEKQKYLKQINGYSSRENIFFLGNRNDVKEILKISDIFVLGTYSEGMSNAILEAMASKVVVITTNIEVNRELIEDNVSGFLVPVRDSKAIGDKIKLLLDDKNKRVVFAENAYKKVLEHFELKRVINLLKKNYEGIIYGG